MVDPDSEGPDMSDIIDLLRSDPACIEAPPASPAVVSADLARGHRALVRRRRRIAARSLVGAGAAAAALLTLVPLATQEGHRTGPAGGGAGSSTASALRLVDYSGPQPGGFTVGKVPTGWSVRSNDDSSFVIQPPGAAGAVTANGPVDLTNDIVVMLQGLSTLPAGSARPVSVNGRPAQIGEPRPGTAGQTATWLIFRDGAGHAVLVQAPAGTFTTDELVTLASSITVSGQVQAVGG
jgi:hypothetical protein